MTVSLAHEVEARLLERLDFIRLQPQLIVNLATATDKLGPLLAKRYRKAKVLVVADTLSTLPTARRQVGWFTRQRFVSASNTSLPLCDQSVDLIIANLLVSTPALWQELSRLLKPGGVLLFSMQASDNFSVDMHTVGDGLIRAGLLDPVIDREEIAIGSDFVQIIYGLGWGADISLTAPLRHGEVAIPIKEIKRR